MNSKRRNEGRVILIISLSSIILWLIISSSSYHGNTILDVLNSRLVNLDLFCEEVTGVTVSQIYIDDSLLMRDSGIFERCAIQIDVKTKAAIIFSFLFSVYGLLVFLGHAPGLTEVWNKHKHQDKS